MDNSDINSINSTDGDIDMLSQGELVNLHQREHQNKNKRKDFKESHQYIQNTKVNGILEYH